MKTFTQLAAAIVITTVAASTFAGPGDKGERLTRKLQLEDTQAKQVQLIMSEQHEKKVAVRAEIQQLRNAKMTPLREETRARLADVLTAEQLEKFDAMQERRTKRHKKTRQHHRGDKVSANDAASF